MSDFLHQMARSSLERALLAPTFNSGDFDKPLVPLLPDPFDIIAEIKATSPAEGALAGSDLDRIEQARAYAKGGAAAISVLTEPSRFDGDLLHVEEVAAALPNTPVMRKDFLVRPIQIDEARAAGASGVLLIVAMLNDAELRNMLDCSFEHGMFVLLESFDGQDLARIARLLTSVDFERTLHNQLLFGVNTRNLRTLEVDPLRLEALSTALPPGRGVAESGLVDAIDARRVAGFGYSLALVGTALMRSDDPAALVAEMKAAGASGLPS